MDTPHHETLKNIISELLEKMGFAATVEITTDVDMPDTLLCSTQVDVDQNFLIGQYGVNLAAIQHIVRILARKQIDEKVNITVDINGYFADKRVLLEKEAAKATEEALQNNVSVALRPMLPYERKVVHSFLSQNPSVTTESIGKGTERKVLVRPQSTETEA